MASSSTPISGGEGSGGGGGGGGGGYASSRMATVAATMLQDNQSLVADIRRALGMMKTVAVDLEKEHQSEKVSQLEGAVLELLETCGDCISLSDSIKSVAKNYQSCDQMTDFKKLLEKEATRIKAESPSNPQGDPLHRQFKEAIWNVHHAGQPMPGEEQEDIIMTSTQHNLKNTTCPLTLRPVTELQKPVRCMDCKHIYESDPIMHYIATMKPQPKCPVAGCPKILHSSRVVCDPLLQIEIDEIRTSAAATATERNQMVEDFTELD